MSVSETEVRHIAKLARLALTDEEIKLYGGQLGAILEYVEQLNALDTASVPPTAHTLGMENVLRSDEPLPCTKREAIIANFPQREFDLLKVKKVIE